MINNKEHRLQVICVKWFRLQHPEFKKLLFAVPNGGTRFKREAVKLKAEGVTAGVSDLLFLVRNRDYNGMAIEMKVKPNKPTASQIEWQSRAKEQGYHCVICYSFEEFKNEIISYVDNM